MRLNVENWKEFKLTDIFIIKGGFYNKKPEHSCPGDIPFLASTESNNGVTEYYSLTDIKSWDKVGNPDDSLEKKIKDLKELCEVANVGNKCGGCREELMYILDDVWAEINA